MPNYRDYSKTAADNTARFPEGMQRQDLNNQLRAMEARHRTFAEELPWFEFSDSSAYSTATQFTVPDDLTEFLTVGSKVRAVGSTTGDIQGEITVSSYSAPNTTVTVVWDSGQLENESLTIYRDVGGGFTADSIVGQTVVNTNAPSTTVHQITAQNSGRLFLLDDTAGNIDLEAPTLAAEDNGFFFRFKLVGAGGNTVRVTTPGPTIDDGTNWTVPQQYASGTIMWDGTEWWIVTLGRNGLATAEVVTSKIADGAVTQSKLADDAVGLANMSHGTGGQIIGYDEDGAPAEVAPGTGNSVARVTHIHANRAGGGESQAFATASNEVYAMGIGSDNANGSHAGATHNLPRKISGIPTDKVISKIVSGYRSHYALMTTGEVYVWGRNSNGQLGLGDTTARDKAEQISGLSAETIVDVQVAYDETSAAACAFFINDSGAMWACGANSFGQLGNGNTTQQTSPVVVTGLTGVSTFSVSCDREPHCIAVLTDNTIRVWGNNDSGQLGLGDTTNRNTPTQPGGVTDIDQAVASSGSDGSTVSGFSLLLKTDGTVLACGDNKSGQLGQGNTTDLSSFTTVTFSPSATITKISGMGGAGGHAVALDDAGDVWTWGQNNFGQCGNGSTTDQTSPQKQSGAWDGLVTDILGIGSERYTGTLIRSPSKAWACGYGNLYNLCKGDAVTNNTSFAEVLGLDGNISAMGCHGFSSNWGLTFLMSDGRMLTGGYGGNGQLGIGNTANSGDLQPVKGFTQKANNPLPNDRDVWALSTRYELGDLSNKAGPPVTYYICKAAHTSSAGTEPGVGASWATYWTFVGTQARDIGNVTVAGLAGFAAGSYTGWLGFITDETGGAVPAFSDGTNWLRVTDRAVVS